MATNKSFDPHTSGEVDSTIPLGDTPDRLNFDSPRPNAHHKTEESTRRNAGDLNPASPIAAISDLDQHDRFRLAELHATGGIGRVWLARDSNLDRDVAVKELRPEFADDAAIAARFEREARITGQLDHPGIVPIYQLGRRQGASRPFYAMRFINGRTLTEASRDYHRQRESSTAEPVDLLQLLNAFVAVCNTVAYAHSRGVIHRDLKGANVILGDFGEVVVVDWGLAKLTSGTDQDDQSPEAVKDAEPQAWSGTIEGYVIGTPSYMSPEQAAGRIDLMDQRTDVYGLGTILYEILTGLPPFSGSNLQQVIRRIQNKPPKHPRKVCPGIPQALEAICMQALAKDPADRHGSVAELAEQVQGWLADMAEEPLKRMAASQLEAKKALRKARDQQRALIELIRSQTFHCDDLEETFRRLTEVAAHTLKVERVSIWRYNRDRSAISCADLYQRTGSCHSSGAELRADAYPAYFEALSSSEVIAAHDPRSDPRTCEFTVGYLNELRIGAMLDAPIHVFGQLDGALCHEHVGQAREWTAEEQLFGIALSNLVSLAIEQWERGRVGQPALEPADPAQSYSSHRHATAESDISAISTW